MTQAWHTPVRCATLLVPSRTSVEELLALRAPTMTAATPTLAGVDGAVPQPRRMMNSQDALERDVRASDDREGARSSDALDVPLDAVPVVDGERHAPAGSPRAAQLPRNSSSRPDERATRHRVRCPRRRRRPP